MDFLEPDKQRTHAIRLIIGYVLIGIAILIATTILLYQAFGFGLGKDGQVIQNGLVFVASQPNDADIFINDKLYKSTTNARVQMEAGQYEIKLQKEGYRSWQRDINLAGGSVEHYTYPILFPNNLVTTPVKEYSSAPQLMTQSPDRRWLIVSQLGSPLAFEQYDLRETEDITVAAESISLPPAIITNAETSSEHSFKLVEWSTDNRHVMLLHTFAGGSEYIMLNRDDPGQSFNVSTSLGLAPGQELALYDKKFDQYYVHDTVARTVQRVSLDEPGAKELILDQVLAYKPYGSQMLLYATEKDADEGMVLTRLRDGDADYSIRQHQAVGPYLVDMAEYEKDWYVAVGASGEDKVYVYKNLQEIRKASQTAVLVPVRVLKVESPTNLSFSSNTRFVMAQGGTQFANYDAETDRGYAYTSQFPIDAPAVNATWMDGHRVTYVSGGKLIVFDYDNTNHQTLMPAQPEYLPVFDRDYRFVYTLAPQTSNPDARLLTSTPLLLPADL